MTYARASTVLLALLLPGALRAQERPPAPGILSDRPGLGDGAHVLGAGVWQLEVGAAWAGGSGADVFSLGQGLLRYGVGPFELRLHPNSFVVARGGDESVEGLEDMAIGLKVPLAAGEGAQVSVVGAVTLPTGADAFTADQKTAWGTLVVETSLSERVGVAFNGGYAFPFDGVGDGRWSFLVTPGFAVPSVEGLGLYAGYAGFYGDGPDTHILEAGLARASGADLQWDVNAGVDVDTGEVFLGVGIARRWR